MKTETIIRVPFERITPNPYQPESRLVGDPAKVQKKAESILANGLIQVPVARQVCEDDNERGEYQIADGWLRYLAFCWLVARGHPEYSELPVVVRELTDQQMADYVFVANKEREDLSPIDLAHFYNNYLANFHITQAELAKRHGCSQGEIANTIRLLELPGKVQQMIITREITGYSASSGERVNGHTK